jgi:hypothetical protein
VSVFGHKRGDQAEHERRRLVVAADWAITTARRRWELGSDPIPVTVADVVERAADDGLVVTREAAAAALRERFELRTGGMGLTTDAFDDQPEATR